MADDLDRLIDLAEKATPGPWEQGDSEHDWHVQTIPKLAANLPRMIAGMGKVVDAEYIAACSPDVIRRLVERVRRAEDLLREVEWNDDTGLCSLCGGPRRERERPDLDHILGHKPDCALAAALWHG